MMWLKDEMIGTRDIEELSGYFKAAGFHLNDIDIYKNWRKYSEFCMVSWLDVSKDSFENMYEMHQKGILRNLIIY